MTREKDTETSTGEPRLRLRIFFGDDVMLGPGKADLLEHIRETGSIAAAGRKMAMSYKRAWSLVEEMNRGYREPLVDSSRGGAKGGGASLTQSGETVLAHYRRIEEITAREAEAEIAALQSMLGDMSEGK
jgi:molybdate transport system regulatory protein